MLYTGKSVTYFAGAETYQGFAVGKTPCFLDESASIRGTEGSLRRTYDKPVGKHDRKDLLPQKHDNDEALAGFPSVIIES